MNIKSVIIRTEDGVEYEFTDGGLIESEMSAKASTKDGIRSRPTDTAMSMFIPVFKEEPKWDLSLSITGAKCVLRSTKTKRAR